MGRELAAGRLANCFMVRDSQGQYFDVVQIACKRNTMATLFGQQLTLARSEPSIILGNARPEHRRINLDSGVDAAPLQSAAVFFNL